MKKLLLLSIVVLFGSVLSAQSLSERLAIRKNTTNKVELKVFPNPVTSFINLSSNSKDIVEKIQIFNLVGRKMKSFDFEEGEKYFVGDLPKGMYLIQLLGAKSQILRTQRVSKR